MAKRSRLATLSIDALVRMRDEIGVILSRKADAMKKELRALGDDYKEVGRIALYGKKKAKGAKSVSNKNASNKSVSKAATRPPGRRKKRKQVAGRRSGTASRAARS
jgi:hypothetical protein